jgi:hypothetical protein
MLTKTNTIARRMTPGRKLNILTCPTHEGYQTNLSRTGHNFYMLMAEGMKGWDFQTRPLPPNHYIFTIDHNAVVPHFQIDLILCQNRLAQYPILAPLAKQWGIPMIVLDHTEPPPGLTKAQMMQVAQMVGDYHVSITEHNKMSWDTEKYAPCRVIPHGIDTVAFDGWVGDGFYGISLVNHFAKRDLFCGYTLWRHIAQQVPMNLYGDNPDLGTESLIGESAINAKFRDARFFLNTSQYSPVPLSLLEAMACGLPPVTTAKQEIPNIIKNGVNGFISNDQSELISFCKTLLNDQTLARTIRSAARQTIIEKFSMEQFVNNWNLVFNGVLEKYR